MIKYASPIFVMATLVAMVAFSPRQLAAADGPIKPGDMIVVLRNTDLQAGTEKLAPVKAGTELVATHIQDDWIGVAVERDGKKVSGWIHRRNLIGNPKDAFGELMAGPQGDEGRARSAFRKIDTNADDEISADEFLAGTKKATLDDLNRQLRELLQSKPALKEYVEYVRRHKMFRGDSLANEAQLDVAVRTFRGWEKVPSAEEAMDIARDFAFTDDVCRSPVHSPPTATRLAGKETPTEARNALFTWADRNRDGKLSPDEFKQALPQSGHRDLQWKSAKIHLTTRSLLRRKAYPNRALLRRPFCQR